MPTVFLVIAVNTISSDKDYLSLNISLSCYSISNYILQM